MPPGLPRESDYPYWTGPEFPFPTHEQIVERLSGQQMLYPPETFWQYSNLGLTLAGEVASAASGQPYAELVSREHPQAAGPREAPRLRCRRTSGASAWRPATAASGAKGKRPPVPFFTTRGVAPAAGYASTVEDLGRFASWQFRLLARAAPRC